MIRVETYVYLFLNNYNKQTFDTYKLLIAVTVFIICFSLKRVGKNFVDSDKNSTFVLK